MQNFHILASLCSWAGWFDAHLVANLKDICSNFFLKIIPYLALHLWATGISSLMKFQSKLVA